MNKWEYEVRSWPWKGLPANQQELAKRGQNGWELVGFHSDLMGTARYREPDEEKQVVAVFKRPLTTR